MRRKLVCALGAAVAAAAIFDAAPAATASSRAAGRQSTAPPLRALPVPVLPGRLRVVLEAAAAAADARLLSPIDDALVARRPTLVVKAPPRARVRVYASLAVARGADGAPAAAGSFACVRTAAAAGLVACRPRLRDALVPGAAYHWWAVIETGASRLYGPHAFVVESPEPPPRDRSFADAESLPHAARFTGASIRETRLSVAASAVAATSGRPMSLSVACWSAGDWRRLVGDRDTRTSTTVALYRPLTANWIHLSPAACRSLETLLHRPPRTPTRSIAIAVDALAHEVAHATGIAGEARAECTALQLTATTARRLGLGRTDAEAVARLALREYFHHPPRYVAPGRCRENGAWDLEPGRPSSPWHGG